MQPEQWNAIIECDSSYDGRFYYGVTTTRIFCRPSCKSRSPKRDNVLVFTTADVAKRAGFRACKRCRPDEHLLPTEELVRKATEYIDAHYGDAIRLGSIAESLHVSPYHMHHVFRRIQGMTPQEYLQRKRVAQAKKLLEETPLSVTEVAIAAGFGNVSHFSTVFRKETGESPSRYRTQHARTVIGG